MIDEKRLHEMARSEVERLRAAGSTFDKKMLRFNDIVAVGVFYAKCGTVPKRDVAEAGVKEAVLACVKGSDFYVEGRGPLSMIQPWMVPE